MVISCIKELRVNTLGEISLSLGELEGFVALLVGLTVHTLGEVWWGLTSVELVVRCVVLLRCTTEVNLRVNVPVGHLELSER